jgi:hypothetical protein
METTRQQENENSEPRLGMGATWYLGSDRYAFTVIAILKPKVVVLQRDTMVCISKDEMTSENQKYEFHHDPKGETVTVSQRKDGLWRKQGETVTRGDYFKIGERRGYSDPGF